MFHASDAGDKFRLGNPNDPDGVSGPPVGFAILSEQQAKHTRPDTTWEQAYGDLKYAMDVRNDWSEGLAVEGTVIVFSDDPDKEPECLGTGYYSNEVIEEVARTLLAETGTAQ